MKRGEIISGRYECLREIGRGGSGRVYLVYDRWLGCQWAAKEVDYPAQIPGLYGEGELLAVLQHPGIPRIVDRIVEGEKTYYIQDYVDGCSLADYVEQYGCLTEDEAVGNASTICSILSYLHTVSEQPILFLDLKPENIMIDKNGDLKLIDFGISRQLRDGQVIEKNLGTPGYAAPEQYKGGYGMLDERTDIYSLGVVLKFMLTGEPGNTAHMYSIKSGEISDECSRIIQKCMEKDPQKRYTQCKELITELYALKQLRANSNKQNRRRLSLFFTALLLAFLGAVVGCLGSFSLHRLENQTYLLNYHRGLEAYTGEDFKEAANCFYNALQLREEKAELYVLYFQSLVRSEQEENSLLQKKRALDEMCTAYIDNAKSAMYQNEQLRYQAVWYCLEIGEPEYVKMALSYIKSLEEDMFDKEELAALEVIALCIKDIDGSIDFESLEGALFQLELQNDIGRDEERRLAYYGILLSTYVRYSMDIKQSYEQICRIKEKAQKIFEDAVEENVYIHYDIYSLYETAIMGIYTIANVTDDAQKKSEAYELCLDWIGEIENTSCGRREHILIKKVNAWRRLYELYPEYQRMLCLEQAYQAAAEAVQWYPDSVLAVIMLAQTGLELENQRPYPDRDYEDVQYWLDRLGAWRDEGKIFTGTEEHQYQSLYKMAEATGIN